MPGRPGWHDEYWDQMDKETARKIRSTCPLCGSSNTYYNKQYGTWRCGKCEHTFVIRGLEEDKPWWKKLFKK
jgi:ribosomal protein L37AE/L43A